MSATHAPTPIEVLAGQTLAHKALSPTGQIIGNVAGLILIALGAVTIVLATWRFRRTAVAIDNAKTLPGPGERIDFLLAGLLTVLGAALFVYLAYTVISRL